MGNKSFGFLVVGCISLASLLCHTYSARLDSDELLYYSIRQYTKLSMSLAGKDVFINTGNPLSSEWNRSPLSAWTVGFYGGSLWILYKLSHDEYWKNLALEYQERIKSRQFDRGTHDVGFVIMSTYGLAMEYGNDNSEETRDYYTQIIHESATSLSSRYNSLIGCTRSWNSNDGLFLVIIDNMMNLELLFRAHELTGNTTFRDIALSHADRTIEEHLREDGGTFHVVGYSEETGEAVRKYNHQGMADYSTWSRGLAWAIHGYTTTYKKSSIKRYLDVAEKAASYFIERLPSDYVPYWDFDAPLGTGEYQPRDASAGSIAAHAFLQLFEITNNIKYLDTAVNIMDGLEKGYRADSKTEYQIPSILVNGTVFYHEKDFNTAIVYADFYYLRAFDLYREIMSKFTL